jgi:hypothetical protein
MNFRPCCPIWSCALAVLVFSASSFVTSAGGSETRPIRFQDQIRPILSDHCFACHGFDAQSREADLRLDLAGEALSDRDGAPAIVPGDPEQSHLWQRITSDDEYLVMPPASTKKPLSDEQKQLLRQWIEQGAPFEDHWAFQVPVKPALPEVRRSEWVRQPIDRFLLARLDEAQLRPSPEADRETLIRRVAFALTGLPPTLDELDQFLADHSPVAYERMVDRYLAAPQFGEEMARHWLDVARYADTHGLHLDNERLMWAYRDWVVRAFNENLSYDQFTLWQLAGDLLPDATPDQQIATGFNRCNVTTSEGGSIAEEFLYRYAVDRTSTAMQAWMGLTAGCAVCHDHKYDPLSTQEFYSLYAFFYSAADPGMDKNIYNTEPILQLPTDHVSRQIEDARRKETESLAALERAVRSFSYQDPADSASVADSGEPPSVNVESPSASVEPPDSNTRPAEETEVRIRDRLWDDFFPLGATTRNTTRNPSVWEADPEFGTPSGYRALRQANSYFHEDILQPVLQPITIPDEGVFRIYVRLDPRDVPIAVAVVVSGEGGTRRVLWGSDSHLYGAADSPDETIRKGPLPTPGTWTQLSFTAEQLDWKPNQAVNSISLQVVGGVVWWDALTLAGIRRPSTDPAGSFQVWWSGLRSKSPPDVPEPLREILSAGPEGEVTVEQREELLHFYLTYVARPPTERIAELRRQWELDRSRRLAGEDAVPVSLVFRDLEEPREAFVMLRGEYDRPGELVEPGVPEVLPPLTKASPDQRATRLDLANWLLASEHPLTARVAVNRFWQQLFGHGLVATSDDFGSQGTPPTHPELLDWLAIEFREGGWDVKQLVRMLVNSAAFRQSSRIDPRHAARDPGNLLYARGPRFRLDAEQIRDNALHVGGLIQLEFGGPGVKGYQPPNIWEPVGYGDSNTRYYLRDHGSALFRRSIYSFLKRTAPPPFMSNFDAPNREQMCAVRERSNTPLQALQLMNDTQHFEAARALAERILAEAGLCDEQRIVLLYRMVLARSPRAEEQSLVHMSLATQRELYAEDPAAARDVVRVGESPVRQVATDPELAAWTLVANLILNLDETVTRN